MSWVLWLAVLVSGLIIGCVLGYYLALYLVTRSR